MKKTSGNKARHILVSNSKETHAPMIDGEKPASSSLVHRVLYGSSELRAGWRLLIFVGIVAALISSTNWIVRRLLADADSTMLFLVFRVINFLIFLFASWAMGRIEGRNIALYGLPWRKMFRGQFWQGVLMGFAAITGLLAMMRAAGVFHFGGLALHGADIWKWAGIYSLVFLLVGLREEFRSRGYLQYTLSLGIGFWPAAVLSAALFGYGHHGNSGEDWIGLFNAGVFGLLACFLLRRTGNLWMPIGFHQAFDWGETYFYGVANSGQRLPGNLLESSSSGPAWLSGGTVGPEGSVLCTLMMVVVSIGCAGWLKEVKYPQAAAERNSPSAALRSEASG